MAKYHLTREARADVSDIGGFSVKRWGREQAKAYLSGLMNTINLVAQNPAIGTCRLELGSDIFSFPHISHVIYYTFVKEQLFVIGILHKRMIPAKHLKHRSTK
jgi:toxin ParE1/3/4